MNFPRSLRIFALSAAMLATASTHAQLPAAPTPETAVISGDVVDSHNGLVPGATISATEVAPPKNAAIAAEEKSLPAADLAPHTVISDSAGHFVLSDLAPGVWTVKVTANDLKGFQAPAITLKPGEQRELQGVVLPIAVQHADVTVTVSMEQVAEQEVHDQEKQRSLAIFPNFNTSYVWNAAPLNAKQKFRLSLRSTLDPISFATAAANAGYQDVTGKYPEYGSGYTGYAKYYGSAYATVFVGHTLSYALFPAVLRQDPRYFYMGPSASVKKRAIHAILSSVLCRGNNGHKEINASHVLGDFTAGYISKAYHPGTNSGLHLALDNTLLGVVGQMGVDLIREFVLRGISTGTPVYGTGKPPREAVDASHP